MVCKTYECMDMLNPAIAFARQRYDDAQALREPRPDVYQAPPAPPVPPPEVL